MTVTWKWYSNRKRINLESFLQRSNIQDYSSLVEKLRMIGVAPPSEEEANECLKAVFPSDTQIKAKKAKDDWGIVDTPTIEVEDKAPPAELKVDPLSKKGSAKKSQPKKATVVEKAVEPEVEQEKTTINKWGIVEKKSTHKKQKAKK